MYVIIVFDPVTSEFKEVVGPFYERDYAEEFSRDYKLENVIITELKGPKYTPGPKARR
jgi:hypothetical protein